MAAIKIQLEWDDYLQSNYLTFEEVKLALFTGNLALTKNIKVTEIKEEPDDRQRRFG